MGGSTTAILGNEKLLTKYKRTDREPVIKGRVVRGFELHDIGISLDTGLLKGRDIPLTPFWFSRSCFERSICFLLLVFCKRVEVILIRVGAVGAPRFGDACCLLNGNALPPLRELGLEAGSTKAAR